jgi:hypothetical protein
MKYSNDLCNVFYSICVVSLTIVLYNNIQVLVDFRVILQKSFKNHQNLGLRAQTKYIIDLSIEFRTLSTYQVCLRS